MAGRLRTIDARTLADAVLEPPGYAVKDLLVQGLHILAGAPKTGKSWLALWLCQQVAGGEKVWGHPTQQGTVLYLCLEDGYRRLQDRLLENQRERNEAQIRMLQAQLNPHFLCNTLDTMKWISKINQVPQVALMSTDLADILRFCISPDEFVPLRREVEILRRYMEIQSIRLSGKCRLEVDMPPELEECRVPKMILQPLAENAILHGLDGVEDGVIWVRVRSQGTQTLTISVEDNGRGLPPELMGPYTGPPETSGRGHLGLYNVDTILKKHYGEAYGLRLGSRPGGPGAAVTASLPLWKEEEIC